jgi:hypothetical protein
VGGAQLEARRRPALLGLSILALYALLCAWFWSFTADDAFIVYRYAENLAAGRGLVFNAGERVSALTSPLHALVCAALQVLTGHVVAGNKLLAVAAVGASAWLAVRREEFDPGDRALALGYILLCPMVVLWTVGGLETPLLLSLVCLAHALRPDARAGTARILAFSLCCGLCVVTRYDAVLFAGPLALASCGQRVRATSRRSEAWLFAAPAALVVGGWLAFAKLYFHDIMPTSYYHKMPDHVIVEWIGYNLVYIAQGLVLTGLCVPLGVAAVRAWKASPAERARLGSFAAGRAGELAGLLLVALYALQTGLSHMMFAFRMGIPYYPILVLATLSLLRTLRPSDRPAAAQQPQWDLLGALAAWQLGVALLMDLSSVNPGLVGEYPKVSRREYVQFLSVLERQADAISADWRQRDRGRPPRIYTYAAGLIPYRLADAYIFDGGLISYRYAFAGHTSEMQASADYVLTLSPRHGSVEDQTGALAKSLQLVTRIEHEFDGEREHFDVWFNPSPSERRLPAMIDGPAAPAPGGDRAGSPRRAPASRGRAPRRGSRRARRAPPR